MLLSPEIPTVIVRGAKESAPILSLLRKLTPLWRYSGTSRRQLWSPLVVLGTIWFLKSDKIILKIKLFWPKIGITDSDTINALNSEHTGLCISTKKFSSALNGRSFLHRLINRLEDRTYQPSSTHPATWIVVGTSFDLWRGRRGLHKPRVGSPTGRLRNRWRSSEHS